MIIVVWELLGGFSGALRFAMGSLIAFGLFSAWNVLIENPRVSEHAKAGYVEIAKLVAEQAKRIELQRQIDAGAQALEEYRKKLEFVQAQDAKDDAANAALIADFERRISAAGKACLLDEETKGFLEH